MRILKSFYCIDEETGATAHDRLAVGSGVEFNFNSVYCETEHTPNSLIAQMVKNLPAMQETQVQFLGWEDPLENGNPLQYFCQESPMDRRAWCAAVHAVTKVRHDLATKPPPHPHSIKWARKMNHFIKQAKKQRMSTPEKPKLAWESLLYNDSKSDRTRP